MLCPVKEADEYTEIPIVGDNSEKAANSLAPWHSLTMNNINVLAMNDTSDPLPSTEALAAWLHRPAFAPNRHSLVIGSRCGTNLKRLGGLVAERLNELDPEARNHWRPFSTENLRQLAGDPAYRDLILGGQPSDAHPGPPDSDLDRVARRLAHLGGAVLEGEFSLDATNDLDNAFRICLCSHSPICIESCHMLVNPERFSRMGLISAIVDSFLDWTSRYARVLTPRLAG